KSHLIKLVTSDDPEQVMPPKGERLKPAEVAVIQRWVESGAHWKDTTTVATTAAPLIAVGPDAAISADDRRFWSFVPPRRTEPPRSSHADWARNRIDRFVLAKMEARGLTPSGQASAEVLIRRLTFDLTGLPPTPAEVDSFVANPSDQAYDLLVDR